MREAGLAGCYLFNRLDSLLWLTYMLAQRATQSLVFERPN